MRAGSSRKLTIYGLFVGALILTAFSIVWIVALGPNAVGIAGLILATPVLVGPLWKLTRKKAQRRHPTAEQLDRAWRDLRVMVHEQWVSEAAALRLYQPKPIPTRWQITEQLA